MANGSYHRLSAKARALVAGIAAGLALTASIAAAEEFPSKAITILVPFAPGPTDTVARIVAHAMSGSLGRPVLVENRPSVGGIVAPEAVKNSRPDGYTILIHHIGMATLPILYRQLRFDPLTDFEYIGLINEVPMTLIGSEKLPPNDLKELIRYIREHKDKVTFAHAGVGAASHLCGLLFMSFVQTEVMSVPYKGTGPAMNDLLGGQVELLCDQTISTTSQIRSGKVKVYGVTTLRRVASLPEIRTLDEQGLTNFDVAVWQALYAPKGTPKPVVRRLSSALQAAVKDPQVIQRFAELGATTYPPEMATSDALEVRLRSEIAKWRPIINKAGIYAD
ncbi:MAG TPA: tripartite tricarboxylate transporter substrate-binding protein [Burkholderiales bacterium]|jgi:tripartite-type tricarboxylate transporter receptor subunit TctC